MAKGLQKMVRHKGPKAKSNPGSNADSISTFQSRGSQHLRSRRLIIADKKPAATSERRWPKLSEEAISRVLKDVRAWLQEEAERLRLIEAKKNLATTKTSCTVH